MIFKIKNQLRKNKSSHNKGKTKKDYEPLKKASEKMKGRKFTIEHKRKLKENHANFLGKNNPMYGKNPKKNTNQWGINNPNWKNGIGGYRKRAFKRYGQKCKRCGITNIKVLLVHHKDRNRTNNKLKNLEILCRNCHLLEHYNEIYKIF